MLEAVTDAEKRFEDWYQNLPTTQDLLPVIDLRVMGPSDCQGLARMSLEEFGLILVRPVNHDPKLRDEMMQRFGAFFCLPEAKKLETVNPSFQGGYTPEFTERAVDQSAFIATLSLENKPVPPRYPKDPKWRRMIKIGDARAATRFPILSPPTWIVPGFEVEYEVADRWGHVALEVADQARAAYLESYGIDPLRYSLRYGAHFVAPTGTDLTRYAPGTVVADLHGDMGVITFHEKSAAYFEDTGELVPCGGLLAWTRSKQLVRVVVPEGVFLGQGGMQLEKLTDGRVLAGKHQVVVPPEGRRLANQALERGTRVIRVTSTLFPHFDGDREDVVPEEFRTPGKEYLPYFQGQVDMDTLNAIFATD